MRPIRGALLLGLAHDDGKFSPLPPLPPSVLPVPPLFESDMLVEDSE